MPYNIRIVTTFPPRRCGVGTFSRDFANALAHFTGEVGSIRVAAIDRDGLPYHIPVDLVIDQYNPVSWRENTTHIINRARESESPTVVLIQHEYGLDPDDHGRDALGTHFVDMVRDFHAAGLMTFIYLHTVRHDPDEHQRSVIQALAQHSERLLVTTESAVDMLASPTYGIDVTRIKHIDHGIRMQTPSRHDRLRIKEKWGLANRFLVTTLGMHSPGKGLEYGIRAYSSFLNESCTPAQRSGLLYIIAGEFHPDFMKADGGHPFQEYRSLVRRTLDESRLRWCVVSRLDERDLTPFDLVLLDTFIDERALLDIYGATNVMILPYLDMQQISSGVLADTVGAGRVAIATKFLYALELLNPGRHTRPGMILDPHAKGILVDPGEPSVDQIAQALDYLVFNASERLHMERRAHQRGHQMGWRNTAWQLIQLVEFVYEEREIISGRGLKFTRLKESVLQKKNEAAPGIPPDVTH